MLETIRVEKTARARRAAALVALVAALQVLGGCAPGTGAAPAAPAAPGATTGLPGGVAGGTAGDASGTDRAVSLKPVSGGRPANAPTDERGPTSGGSNVPLPPARPKGLPGDDPAATRSKWDDLPLSENIEDRRNEPKPPGYIPDPDPYRGWPVQDPPTPEERERIRKMAAEALDPANAPPARPSSGDLAKDAGIDDIGRSPGSAPEAPVAARAVESSPVENAAPESTSDD